MVLRRPKPYQSFEPFWGCGQYPDCRGTRSVVEVNEDQLQMWGGPTSHAGDVGTAHPQAKESDPRA